MNNQQAKEIKEWVKPELIVLVRSKPDEQVLTGCKTSAFGNRSLLGSNDECAYSCAEGCNAHVSS